MPRNRQVKYPFKQPIAFLSIDLPVGIKEETHAHAFAQFTYAASGILFVGTEQGSYIVPPNRGVWIPEGLKHNVEIPNGAKIRSLFFTLEQATSMPVSCCVLEVSPLFRSLISEAAKLPKEYDWDGKEGRIMRVIRDQISQMNKVELYLPLPQDNKLQKITRHFLTYPADNRSIDEWGSEVGASGRTLSRLYFKETGMSFRNWRQQLKLQVAIQDLADGKSVTTAALNVGYSSVSAFIAMFRRQMGYTPGDKESQ